MPQETKKDQCIPLTGFFSFLFSCEILPVKFIPNVIHVRASLLHPEKLHESIMSEPEKIPAKKEIEQFKEV